jgi:hypothetical protein
MSHAAFPVVEWRCRIPSRERATRIRDAKRVFLRMFVRGENRSVSSQMCTCAPGPMRTRSSTPQLRGSATRGRRSRASLADMTLRLRRDRWQDAHRPRRNGKRGSRDPGDASWRATLAVMCHIEAGSRPTSCPRKPVGGSAPLARLQIIAGECAPTRQPCERPSGQS